MNDPYEFYFNFEDLDDDDNEEKTKNIKDRYNQIIGFLCFTENMNNPVQWAHYADSHKGLCLEFEIPSNLLVKIDYRKEPLSICSKDLYLLKKEEEEKFTTVTRSKYDHWKYEQERRMVIKIESAKEIIRENGLLFWPLSDELSLKTVYSGLRCRLCEDQKALLKEKNIELIETARERTSYLINPKDVTDQ